MIIFQANRSGTDADHRALQAGLLYLSLTESAPRRSFCADIVLTSRDNLTYVLSEMTRLVAETWLKMSLDIRCNFMVLVADFVSASKVNCEVLLLHICRRMQSQLLCLTYVFL